MAGTHSVTWSFLNVRDTPGYTLYFKWLGYTRLHIRFQMILPYLVSHLFPNGRETRGYTLVFKWLGHARLHGRF